MRVSLEVRQWNARFNFGTEHTLPFEAFLPSSGAKLAQNGMIAG